jgi:3-dehydroquinate dehydratase/shikimate dehydrogenase
MRRRPLLIEVVSRATTSDTVNAYRQAHPRADLVEMRLDRIKDLDLDRLVAARGKPKLMTMRSVRQGGMARPADREVVLARLQRAPIEYLDIEPDDADLPFLRRRGGPKRVLSWHDFQATPLDLVKRLQWLRGMEPKALVKMVTFADLAGDILRIRDLLRGAGDPRLIAFCMGPKGVPSRILAPLWGSAAHYAPRAGAPRSAPGQVPIEDLLAIYRSDDLRPDTRLLGVLGSPVGHSLSPIMHNAALRALGLNMIYLPFEATTVAEFLPILTDLRLKGLSVTLPFKESILPHLDRLSRDVRKCGAANTVVKVWNRFEGHNTDMAAAVEPLRRRMRLSGARVAVMGAGGAARAVVEGLRVARAEVTIFNRTAARAASLARATGSRSLPWKRLRGYRCDLLVNATPIGLHPDTRRTPIPISWVRAPMVYDLIYNPPETLFLRRARRAGLEILGGVEMFVAQGAAQFRLFTGREAPVEVMRRAVDTALAGAPS